MNKPAEQFSQSITGAGARIAGRDYYENCKVVSLNYYLATTPSDQLDSESIDNERLFRRRFLLHASKPQRAQFIGLKRTYGFTDSQLRWLRNSGQVCIDRYGVHIKPNRVIVAIGVLFLTYMTLLSLCSGLTLLCLTDRSLSFIASALSLLVASAATSWFAFNGFVAPWKWLRDAGALSSSAV